ncbi:hypothetical protein ABIE50_001770 [Chitinophaga sp. OAE865]
MRDYFLRIRKKTGSRLNGNQVRLKEYQNRHKGTFNNGPFCAAINKVGL